MLADCAELGEDKDARKNLNVGGNIREIVLVPGKQVVHLAETIPGTLVSDEGQGILLEGHACLLLALPIEECRVHELNRPRKDGCGRIRGIVIWHEAETFDEKVEDGMKLGITADKPLRKLLKSCMSDLQVVDTTG